MKQIRLLSGIQDIRTNKEDFVLTPFLFLVYVNTSNHKVFGIGICLFWWAIHLSLGVNIPKEFPSFKIRLKK